MANGTGMRRAYREAPRGKPAVDSLRGAVAGEGRKIFFIVKGMGNCVREGNFCAPLFLTTMSHYEIPEVTHWHRPWQRAYLHRYLPHRMNTAFRNSFRPVRRVHPMQRRDCVALRCSLALFAMLAVIVYACAP